MAYIVVTEACNQNCWFCSAAGRNSNLTKEQLAEMIMSIRPDEQVVITGGEPTLFKDILWVVKEVRKRTKEEIELQTNGTLLYKFENAKKLVEAGVDVFNVNFPSHIPEISDVITRAPGTFEKRVIGMKNIIKAGGKLRITMVLNSLNKNGLMGYVRYVKDNFPELFLLEINFVKILGNAKANPWMVPTYSEVEEPLKRAVEFCKRNGIRVMIDGIPLCKMRGFEDVSVDLIKKRMGSDRFFEVKGRAPSCKLCKAADVCRGFRLGYEKIHGVGEFHPLTNVNI